jgi:hypothetical protein
MKVAITITHQGIRNEYPISCRSHEDNWEDEIMHFHNTINSALEGENVTLTFTTNDDKTFVHIPAKVIRNAIIEITESE